MFVFVWYFCGCVTAQAIGKLQERAQSDESQALFSVVNDLSKVLSKKLSAEEVLDLVYPLFDGLLDVFTDGGDGSCVVINGLIKCDI